MWNPSSRAERLDTDRRKSDHRVRKHIAWEQWRHVQGSRLRRTPIKNLAQMWERIPWQCRWIADQHCCSCHKCNQHKRRVNGNSAKCFPIQELRERQRADCED